MPEQLVISFPHMGNYYIPAEIMLSSLFPEARILPPPVTTVKTLETGCRYSPDSVCAPFKYNVGNFIEALERGANVLVQTGAGCIFGYYGALQERILRDLGYDFRFLCLSYGKTAVTRAFDVYKSLGGRRSPRELAETAILALGSARILDRFEYSMRENAAFETIPGSFDTLHRNLLRELRTLRTLPALLSLKNRYAKAVREIKTDKPHGCLRVGIVGELFTLMEPFANLNIESELIKSGISVSRRMSASFLLSPHTKESVRQSCGYLGHMTGANGADSVAQTRLYAQKGYDGVIHMKSFGCVPEVNVMPALSRVSRDYGMPVMHLSFDTQNAEAGLQTRLEAFVDMMRMRRAGAVC